MALQRIDPTVPARPVKSDLASRLADKLRDKVPTAAGADAVLLCDVSGSMGMLFDNKRRVDHVVDAVKQFPTARKFVFSDGCEEVHDLSAFFPHGGTNLAGAFEQLKSLGIRKCILISDGEPNWPEEDALNAARGMRVDILYIGNPPRPPFLDALERITGGTAEMIDPRQIATKVRALLK